MWDARPVTAGVALLDLLRTLYSEKYAPMSPRREGGRCGLALLSGGEELLGNWDREKLLAAYQEECETFSERKVRFHLYT